MTDPYAPVALLAAISALGAFAFEDAGIRQRLGLDPAAADSPYGVLAVSYRPAPARSPSLTAAGPPIVQALPRTLPDDAAETIVARARREVEAGVRYDASYRLLPSYPNGDVPADRGACTDVVIRAFRAVGVDLQVLVHDDIVSDPGFYGAEADANVDHRRVPTLYSYFARHTLPLARKPRSETSSFLPGDVVFYSYKRCFSRYPCAPEHVAVVSDRVGPRGLPLVLQNGGPRATESDALDRGTMVGHFRFPRVVPRSPAPAPALAANVSAAAR